MKQLTLNQVPIDPFDTFPRSNPLMFDDSAFAEFKAEWEQVNREFSEAVEKLANPVQVIDGDCKRCGHNGTVFYKRDTASYCWDCFRDLGHVGYYEYDDIMDAAEVAKW